MKKLIVHATTAKTNSDGKIYVSMAGIYSNDEQKNYGKNEN